jgi:hypothetical protein
LVESNDLVISLDEHGMPVPYNNTHLQMPEAHVSHVITSTSDLKEYSIFFDANYTIFNPNETTNFLIGAPFSRYNISSINNFQVLANGTEIDYELFQIEFDENTTWFDYLDGFQRNIFVSNLTLTSNSSLILHYSFDYKLSWIQDGVKIYSAEVWYDVGTARAWSGNITELVEFTVYGKQPYNPRCLGRDEIGWYEKETIITSVENGFNYAWFWENERIKENRIEMSFSLYREKLDPIDTLIMSIVIPSTGLILAISVTLVILRIRRKSN